MASAPSAAGSTRGQPEVLPCTPPMADVKMGEKGQRPDSPLSLHKAVLTPGRHACLAAVYACLATGVSVNQRDTSRRTALHVVAGKGRDGEAVRAVVRALADEGADVNARGLSGCGAGAAAAWSSVAGRESEGRTALHEAALYSARGAAAHVISALAAAGADVSAADLEGSQPVHLAMLNWTAEAAAEAAAALLGAGADPCALTADGCPPLVLALERPDADRCHRLLQLLSGAGPAVQSDANSIGGGGGEGQLLHLAAAGLRCLLKRRAEAEAEQEECVVCKDAPRTMALLPCSHLAFCDSCALRVSGQPCPICRKPSTHAVAIHRP
ncbi:hypothetical protein ABPG75_013835 [Micractinium tetrahymenae]